jgi:hypothetical protein
LAKTWINGKLWFYEVIVALAALLQGPGFFLLFGLSMRLTL